MMFCSTQEAAIKEERSWTHKQRWRSWKGKQGWGRKNECLNEVKNLLISCNISLAVALPKC